MLYIPCVEFQFCIHYIQLPLEKMANLISKGGQDYGKGAKCPPAPKCNPDCSNFVCSILESICTRDEVNSKGHTRSGVNCEVCTRGGVNSDHTANRVSTEQGTLMQAL